MIRNTVFQVGTQYYCFNENGLGALVNSSRGIIAAHTKDQYKGCFTDETEFAKAARQACIDMKNDLRRCI